MIGDEITGTQLNAPTFSAGESIPFASRSKESEETSGEQQRPLSETGEREPMSSDLEQLWQRVRPGLDRVDRVSAALAVASTFVFFVLFEVDSRLSLLLGFGVYAGVHLLRSEPAVGAIEPVLPESAEVFAFNQARESNARITASLDQIQKAALRKRVASIVHENDKMLDAMEEDDKFAAAPLYESRLVRPFEELLVKDLKLRRRGVQMGAASSLHIETDVLPRFEKASREFYENWHQSDVLDLAALAEIITYNLDSIDSLPFTEDLP